ncbi:MAG: hypothetical protein OXM55_03665, partial [Bdellovibrionales bacterium]|nr:hypothetical protein [Bdellovibrionales bacterium]
ECEEAEAEMIKQGLIKKGGYMDIKELFREEGQQEGWQKGRQEIALNMLKKSAKISFISEITGLSEEEIKKIQKGE